MKLRQADHLPLPVQWAMQRNIRQPPPVDWEKKRVRVSALMNPPWMSRLLSEHHDELETIPTRLIPSLIGNCVHESMEFNGLQGPPTETWDGDAVLPEMAQEEEVSTERLGWKIVGHFDYLEGDTLWDYKVTSVWSWMKPKEEWEAQLNTYAYILNEERPYRVEKLANCMFFKDWSASGVRRYLHYPPYRIMPMYHQMWLPESTEEYLDERLEMLETLYDTPCSDEDRWKDPDKWRVTPQGAQRGKLFPSVEAANAAAKEIDGLTSIERVEFPARRCAEWCDVARFCEYRG